MSKILGKRNRLLKMNSLKRMKRMGLRLSITRSRGERIEKIQEIGLGLRSFTGIRWPN